LVALHNDVDIFSSILLQLALVVVNYWAAAAAAGAACCLHAVV